MSDFLRLFGSPGLRLEGRDEPQLLDWQMPVALMAYLACRPGWHSRESVAQLLRPDASSAQARAYLRRLIHRTREILPGLRALRVEESRLQWDGGCDVRAFEEAMASRRWQEASGLQPAPLLAEAPSLGLLPLDDWFEEERRRLHQKQTAGLTASIAQARQRGEDAASWMARLAAHDPLDEHGVAFLLQHARTAMERTVAAAAFDTLSRRLSAESGRQPSSGTVELRRGLGTAVDQRAPAAGPQTLLGRDQELAALARLIQDPNVRLVTIHGFGGVGKTVLAKSLLTQAAAQGIPVAWVDLLPVDSGHGLLDALATQLDAPAREGSMESQLGHWLATRPLLVFLDNFEQLRVHAAALSRLLQAAAGLRFVVTSRETLGLAEEHSFVLRGLAWQGGGCAAARLFEWHAGKHGTPTGPADEPAVGELVAFFEGLPLAIELAAQWVALLPPQALLAELRHNPAFLDAAPSDAPASRSMRSVLESAWARLDDAEQDALASLSVVRGAMTLGGARAVAACDAAVFLRLAGKSLLQKSPGGSLRLHPLVREFARARADARQLAQARLRHARHFLGSLAQPPALHVGQHLPERMDQLLPQAEDIASAWRTAVADAQWDLAAAASHNLFSFLFMSSRYEDAQALAAVALAALPADDPLWAPVAAAWALAAFRLGQVDEAQAVAEKALLRARPGTGLALLELAMSRVHRFGGRPAAALAAAQHALQAIGDSDVYARLRVTEDLALCHWMVGDPQAAQQHLLASLELARRSDAPFAEARALCLLGFVKEATGSAADALQLLQSSVAIFEQIGDTYQIAFCRRGMSYAFLLLEDFGRQREAAQAALEAFEASGYGHELGESVLAVALALIESGREGDALTTLRRALTLCLQHNQVPIALYCIAVMGKLLAPQGRAEAIALNRFALGHPAWRKTYHPTLEQRYLSLPATQAELDEALGRAAPWRFDEVCGRLLGTAAFLDR